MNNATVSAYALIIGGLSWVFVGMTGLFKISQGKVDRARPSKVSAAGKPSGTVSKARKS
jgi:hypothetical protein